MQVVIIGAGAAGLTTAMELRRLDKAAEITVLDKADEVGYSPCSLPYVISGELGAKGIFHTTAEELADGGIELIHAEAKRIDRKARRVFFVRNGKEDYAGYGFLVLATGSVPFIPPIEGIEKARPLTLRRLDDAKRIAAAKGRRVVIIGGGLAGIEIAAALRSRGKDVTLLEAVPHLAPLMLDADASMGLERHLDGLGIRTLTGCSISKVSDGSVHVNDGKQIPYDTLIVAAGVVPCIRLAKEAGLECSSAIVADRWMRTSDSRIFACGDCAEVKHFLSQKRHVPQSAVAAVRQAAAVAMNISGKAYGTPAPLDASISVASGLHFGSVGVTAGNAARMGVKTVAASCGGTNAGRDAQAKEVWVKVVAAGQGIMRGRVIGVQVVGGRCVPDIINTASLAIGKGMRLADLEGMETCYNPAAAPLHHALVTAARACMMKLKNSG